MEINRSCGWTTKPLNQAGWENEALEASQVDIPQNQQLGPRKQI